MSLRIRKNTGITSFTPHSARIGSAGDPVLHLTPHNGTGPQAGMRTGGSPGVAGRAGRGPAWLAGLLGPLVSVIH
jgi:hypothetical protein